MSETLSLTEALAQFAVRPAKSLGQAADAGECSELTARMRALEFDPESYL